jgi:hypothetical protein
MTENVVRVLGCGGVTEVTENLDGRGNARNGFAPHPAHNKTLGRIAKGATAGLSLQPATLPVEGDGVEVELLAGAAQDEPNRQLVFV